YTLSNVRYIIELIEPAESIMAQYRDAFMAGGLNLPFTTYTHRRKITSSGTQSETVFNFDFNLQSATHALAVLRGAVYAQGTSAVVKASHSLSTFLRDDIEDFVYRLDSEYYPNSQRVNIADNVGAEAWAELQKTIGHHGSTLFESRITMQDWLNDGHAVYYNVSN